MPQRLKQRQEKIKEKRKHTPWREFVKEICSLRTLNFYKNKAFISTYPPLEHSKQLVSHKIFETKRNDTDSSSWYNSEVSFFDNFRLLFKNTNLPPTILFWTCENADFSDQTVSAKNVYLSYVVIRDCENILYSLSVKENSSNILNSIMVRDNCDNVYFSKGIIKSFKIFYSKYITNSSNLWFCSNMISCNECISCSGLENQQYCIDNQQYSKEEYLTKKQQLLARKNRFLENYLNLTNNWNNIASTNTTGNFNIQCSNVENGFYNAQIKNGRNLILIGGKEPWENIYDCFLNTPLENDVYWVFSTGFCDNVYNCHQVSGGSHLYYSYMLEQCSYCLWCIWLKNKSYCILNKQYTKEERYDKVDEIFTQMEKDWTLWKFFPWNMNPFYFNDTAAYLIDDTFTKEEVEAEGYLRRDEKIKVDIPEGAEIVRSYSTSTQNKPPLDPLLAGGAEANKVPPCEGGHPSEAREGGKNNRESIDDLTERVLMTTKAER